MAKSKKKNICVIGAGRFGTAVVEQFVEIGQSVLVIDTDEQTLSKLPSSSLISSVIADASDVKVLESLGVQDMETIIVALSNNIEIIAALLEINVEHIIARASSSRHARVLRQIGVDVIVRPEKETGIRTALIATNSNFIRYSKSLMEIGDGFVIGSSSVLNENYINIPIRDLKFNKVGITLVLIKRGNNTILPTGDLTLNLGDIVTIVGKVNNITKFFGELNENDINSTVVKRKN